jgi:hypothetical protein
MVRCARLAAAASMFSGAARVTGDLYQVPRIMPWQRTALPFAPRVLSSFTTIPAKVAIAGS